MPKTAVEQLEELAIRCDQSYKDGRVLLSTKTASRLITLLLKALKETR